MTDLITELKALQADSLEAQQADREIAIIENRAAVTLEAANDLARLGGHTVLKARLHDIIDAMVTLQISMINDSSLKSQHFRILSLSPEQCAVIVFEELLNLAAREDDTGLISFETPVNTLEKRIGEQVERCARMNMLQAVRKGGKKLHANSNLTLLANEFGVQQAQLSRWNGKCLPAVMNEITGHKYDVLCILTGHLLFDAVRPVVTDLFKVLTYMAGKRKNKRRTVIRMRDEVVEMLEEAHLELTVRQAALGFMISKPSPLTATSVTARGRYVTQLSASVPNKLEPSADSLRAANAAQDVGYTVNTVALQALQAATDEQRKKLVKYSSVPETAHKDESATKLIARQQSVALSNRVKLSTLGPLQEAAEEALEYDMIYFPSYMDFRGRVYSVDYKGLGPQSSKTAKALLQFANAAPLGTDGLAELYRQLGNAMGWDKDTLADKEAKARQLPIETMYEGEQFWWDGDEPLKALTLADDIRKALASGQPATYMSHQICYVDGTCNGMQHLSLMTRDLEGATASNVTGSLEKRSDLYAVVADSFLTELEDYADHEAFEHWADNTVKSLRDPVKQPVMTTYYGVTKMGISKQVVKNGYATRGAQAELFTEVAVKAIDGAAPKAMELRAWLVEVADILAQDGVTPTWTTPNGTVVTQAYRKPTWTRVNVLGKNTRLPNYETTTGRVDTKKQKSSIVANLIHSYDATMLQGTACRMLDQDITDLSFVHDSYGAHAGSMAALGVALRTEAYDMYVNNPLESIRAEFAAQTTQQLPTPPSLGGLNVADVRDSSPYFFS